MLFVGFPRTWASERGERERIAEKGMEKAIRLNEPRRMCARAPEGYFGSRSKDKSDRRGLCLGFQARDTTWLGQPTFHQSPIHDK